MSFRVKSKVTVLGCNQPVSIIGIPVKYYRAINLPPNTPKNENFLRVKIIHHVLIYEVPFHVITDICHTTL